MEIILYVLTFIWTISFIIFLIYLYEMNSRPYLSNFTGKIYDKVPSSFNPNELSMLMNKKIIPSVFTASFLILIKKKIISVKKNESDYVFYRQPCTNLSNSQKDLLSLVFEEIGKGDTVSLSQMISFCDTHNNCSTFLFGYQIWRKDAYREIKYNFFEQKKGYKTLKIVNNFGVLLILANFFMGVHFIPIYCLVIPIYFLNFYFYKIYKRTEKANTEYFKWLGYKNYLLTKNIISKDEESYATVYGVILGLATILDEKLIEKGNFIISLEATITRCVRNATLKGDRSIHLPWSGK